MDISKLITLDKAGLEKMKSAEHKKIDTAKANIKLIDKLLLADSVSPKKQKHDSFKDETTKTENANNQPTQSTNVNPQNNQVDDQPTVKSAVGNPQNI